MAYRLLGSGTTNSDGKATYTYTGVGAGELDVVASLDNPIVSGSVQSEPYPLCDALWTDHDMTTWYNNTSFSIDTTDGVTVTNSASSNKYLFADTTNGKVYSPNFAVEFTFVSYTGTVILRLDNGTNKNKYISALGLAENDKFRMEVLSDQIKYYKNGVELTDHATSYNSADSDVGFIINNGSIHWRDFRIYPI